jgi:SWI/SNF-related matrix-associated actin-dependent regulator of chromatin subfamily A member 5
LKELWTLVHWLYPSIFVPSTQRLFQDSFDLSRGSYSLSFLKAAKDLLATIMLRRTKSVVEMSVPPKEELTVFIPLTEAQRFWTYRLLTRMDGLDLQQIFAANLEPNQEIDEGRRQVQEQIQAQILQNRPDRQKSVAFPSYFLYFCDLRVDKLFSLEEVDESSRSATKGL